MATAAQSQESTNLPVGPNGEEVGHVVVPLHDWDPTAYMTEKVSQNLEPVEIAVIAGYIQARGTDFKLARTIAGVDNQERFNRIMRRPLVREALHMVVLEMFSTDAIMARQALVDLASNTNTPASVRRQAAMDILHMAKLDPGHTINVNKREHKRIDISRLSDAERELYEKLLAKLDAKSAKEEK